MAINVANEPDPRLLGQYAYEAGRLPAIRENLVESQRLAADAAKANAQLSANAQQDQLRAESQLQQQAMADARALQQEQAKQLGFEKLNENKSNEAALDRQQQWQNAEANRRQKEQLAYEDRVAEGLKNGTLYYTSRQKQQLAEIDRNIAEVSQDPSFADDHREEALAVLTRQRRSVIPSVRSIEERPVPLEEKMASGTVVLTDDGQVVPLAKLGRGLRPGEKLGTSTTRNGNEQFKWEDAVKPQKTEEEKPTAAQKAWSNPVSAMQLENAIRTQIQSRLDVEYKNKMADWKHRKAQHDIEQRAKVAAAPEGSSTQPEPFKEQPPQLQRPSEENVGHELYRRSGGLQGVMPPEVAAQMLESAIATMSGASRQAGQKVLDLLLGTTPARRAPVTVDTEDDSLSVPPSPQPPAMAPPQFVPAAGPATPAVPAPIPNAIEGAVKATPIPNARPGEATMIPVADLKPLKSLRKKTTTVDTADDSAHLTAPIDQAYQFLPRPKTKADAEAIEDGVVYIDPETGEPVMNGTE